MGETKFTQADIDELVISFRGWLERTSSPRLNRLTYEEVWRRGGLDVLAEDLMAFATTYGHAPSVVFVGPSHWLAINKITMIYGKKVVVVGAYGIEIG